MYYCCTGIAHACNACNNAFACGCQQLNYCFKRPFSLCTLLTIILLLVPGIIFSVVGLTENDVLREKCKNSHLLWLVLFSLSLILNACFSFYLFSKFLVIGSREYQEEGQVYLQNANPAARQHSRSVSEEFTHLLCYDFVTLGFIFLTIVQLIACGIETAWLKNEEVECLSYKTPRLSYVIIGIFSLYLLIGAFLLCCSVFQAFSNEGNLDCITICCCCLYCTTCGLCFEGIWDPPHEIHHDPGESGNRVGRGALSIMSVFGIHFGENNELEMDNNPSSSRSNRQYDENHGFMMNHPQMTAFQNQTPEAHRGGQRFFY